MRIALRPSGGRGDYELSGSYNGVSSSNLFEKRFLFQITPSLTIDGKSQVTRLNGKPRIRPVSNVNAAHPYIIIYSILLLPPPRRELAKTTNFSLTELVLKEYVLSAVDVDILEQSDDSVTLLPRTIWAKNQKNILKIDFAERMAIISSLWAAASGSNKEICTLLLAHRKAVIESDHENIISVAKKIQTVMQVKSDVVPFILRELNLYIYNPESQLGITNDDSGYEIEDVIIPEMQAQRDRIYKWRRQVDRGPGARKFSIDVRSAYNFKCVFSGERFPKLSDLDSAGVDGAHILPWSTHDLNSVQNGLCLCKQCHWGFDNGLLKLSYDTSTNQYLLSISESVRRDSLSHSFDIEFFDKNSGVIDESRLPANPTLWPSPAYINEFNLKAKNILP